MMSSDEVNALQMSYNRSTSPSRDVRLPDQRRYDAKRESINGKRCLYCNRQHAPSKQACPAFGKLCNWCSKPNHIQAVCKAKTGSGTERALGSSKKVDRVNQLFDEQLLALKNISAKRICSQLHVEGHPVRFVLGCGATVNLLPVQIADVIDPDRKRRMPPKSTLRMFDNTALRTEGMLTASVQHSRTHRTCEKEVSVATTHNQPIFGSRCMFEVRFAVDN